MEIDVGLLAWKRRRLGGHIEEVASMFVASGSERLGGEAHWKFRQGLGETDASVAELAVELVEQLGRNPGVLIVGQLRRPDNRRAANENLPQNSSLQMRAAAGRDEDQIVGLSVRHQLVERGELAGSLGGRPGLGGQRQRIASGVDRCAANCQRRHDCCHRRQHSRIRANWGTQSVPARYNPWPWERWSISGRENLASWQLALR